MELSVVIATFNRAERLLRTLRSLADQTLDAALWEVAVVDNNSTDSTAQTVSEFSAAHPELNVIYVTESRQGLSYARNRGIDSTSGEIIIIIDDDEIVNPQFLEAYRDVLMAHPEAAGAGGAVVPLYESERPAWMTRYTESPIAGTFSLSKTPVPFPPSRCFMGGNMALRRRTVEEFGRFDVRLGRRGGELYCGEEKDIYMRIVAGGGVCWYVPDAVVTHMIPDSRLTREYFSGLCYRIGCSERIRTGGGARWLAALVKEALKWCAVIVLAAWYAVRGQAQKSRYLILMRSRITAGLLTDVQIR